MSTDTTPEAVKVQLQILRRMDGERRLRLSMELSDNLRDIALAGIRHRHPGASTDELCRPFFQEFLGIDIDRWREEMNRERSG